jgi:uncharacterized membrane protein
VIFSTPGTYVASFTVTDNGGSVSPPATRTITVPDFSLSATPASGTVLSGGNTTYTATVTPGTGFAGTVALSANGLPQGAAVSFSPASVNTSGSTTLSVSTSASTPSGSYPLTITGTSGPLAHSVNVTLVVNADFTISVAPPSATIIKGDTASYTVTITSGFSGTVGLSLTGVPRSASPNFTPTSVVNSGTSVLTVNTKRNVKAGTYNLTITGTGGGLVHSANVPFIVR